MLKRIVVLMAVVVALAALLVPSSTHASMSTLAMSKVNHLTFNTPVRLPGALLTPGTYTFQAGPQGNSLDIVRVTTRDGRRILYTGFTAAVTRATRGPIVSFGEAPAGSPQPIAVWYEDGSTIGHQFRY